MVINPITINLPQECEVYNFLYRTQNSEYLVQDQLSVALPNGYFIDVIWAPEHDPSGEYIIRVFYEYWNKQQSIPFKTRNIDTVVQIVENLTSLFLEESKMKKWFQSKTVWVNSVTLVAGVLGYLVGHELIADNASLVAMLVAVQGAVNVVLRFMTWTKIG